MQPLELLELVEELVVELLDVLDDVAPPVPLEELVAPPVPLLEELVAPPIPLEELLVLEEPVAPPVPLEELLAPPLAPLPSCRPLKPEMSWQPPMEASAPTRMTAIDRCFTMAPCPQPTSVRAVSGRRLHLPMDHVSSAHWQRPFTHVVRL